MKHYLILISIFSLTTVPVFAAPPVETVDSILCRGTSAVGFSYEWGGECWCSNGCEPDLVNCEPGVCTVNEGGSGCPDCTHSGTYGADCSGFVSKAWQVPDPYATSACDVSRYTAASFTQDHDYWDVVPMDSLEPGDAVASSSHVILVIGPRDAWGDHEVVEAKGCIYGIVRQSRTFSADYSGARRVNITECNCNEGDTETVDCGDCGTKTRECVSCRFGEWSDCEGPSPQGDAARCETQGSGTGECAFGTLHCVAGWLTCQKNLPSSDVCDGLDNDCDGVVDNGTPEVLGEGFECINSCGEGISQCHDGALACVTQGNIWPDTSCPEPEGNESDSSGCSCKSTAGDSPGLPVFILLAIAAISFRRRYH